MREFLKIGLFIIAVSIFFTACSNKSIEKKVEKPKIKTINDVLRDSFEYDANQKIYKSKSAINKIEDANILSSKFQKFCLEKEGKLVYTDYDINQNHTNSYPSNVTNICEVNNTPYFIIQKTGEPSNIYYFIGMDEQIKKDYLDYKNNKQLELIKINKENTEKLIKERQEIQKREIAREQKTKILLGQKNQRTMTFFDKWRYSGSESLCSKKCNDINLKTTGYKSLKEALSNNWQFVSKVDDIEEAVDDNCTCTGSSLVVKK